MGFSVTGNLLTGSMNRPDIVTFVFSESDAGYTSTNTITTNSTLNRLGYIPLVSTITGLSRALLATVHTIVHLGCAIFLKNRQHHLQEAVLGAKNIGLGTVSAIPIIGNIAVFVIDAKRMKKSQEMAKAHVKTNPSAYINSATMFIYGQEIAKRPMAEFYAESQKLNGIANLTQIEKIIRNS